MNHRRRIARFGLLFLAGVVLPAWQARPAVAQEARTSPNAQFELADAVQIDQVDNAVRVQLERAKALLADRQWDEAINIFRQMAEDQEGKLVAVGGRRYVGLREWCQWQLAALPPEALRIYLDHADWLDARLRE
jgi:hypothetical protein